MLYDKTVYVSHPYGGSRINSEVVAKEIIKLQKKFPNILFISPIHCFEFAYNAFPYQVGMKMCLGVLNKCDEMWISTDYWTSSKGCKIEVCYCNKHNIPIKFKNDIDKL